MKGLLANLRTLFGCGPAPARPVRAGSIRLENVALCYRRSAQFAFSRYKHLRQTKEFWALRGISFAVQPGETIGITGRNGSGKSTMAMLCAGVLPPDKGSVEVVGKVNLLTVGIGFQNDLTGRENVYISGTLLGLTRREVTERMDEILEFTELGSFLDEPVRIYSSGMRSRLGFAVSTIVEPDVLILDEAMSTGDEAFRLKAERRMEEMREKAQTAVVISHSIGQLQECCQRLLWFEKGKVLMDGPTEEVLGYYKEFCKSPEKWLRENRQVSHVLDD